MITLRWCFPERLTNSRVGVTYISGYCSTLEISHLTNSPFLDYKVHTEDDRTVRRTTIVRMRRRLGRTIRSNAMRRVLFLNACYSPQSGLNYVEGSLQLRSICCFATLSTYQSFSQDHSLTTLPDQHSQTSLYGLIENKLFQSWEPYLEVTLRSYNAVWHKEHYRNLKQWQHAMAYFEPSQFINVTQSPCEGCCCLWTLVLCLCSFVVFVLRKPVHFLVQSLTW